jgi:phage virion morphogenesis protein
MPSPGLIYKYDDKEMQKRIGKAIRQCEDLTPVLEIIGEIGTTSIQKNFDEYGRPAWPELKASTMDQRIKTKTWPGQILVVSGKLKDISTDVSNTKVTWSPGPGAADYAAIHNFGGMAGRGKKTKIEKREYLLLQEEDKIEIHFAVRDHVMEE